MNTFLDKIEINPPVPPIASIIWLHGLGADGHDFVPVVSQLHLPENLPVRFIFPHAPLQPVTINNGYVMRAWYDIVSSKIDDHADKKGIKKSVEQLQYLINEEEKKGIPANKIILAGFSQGAVIALITALGHEKSLAGVLALSGYLPFAENILVNANPANQNTPLFLAHGTEDTVVPYFLGEATKNILIKNHYNVTYHSYVMAHSVCAKEIRDIQEWLKSIINA